MPFDDAHPVPAQVNGGTALLYVLPAAHTEADGLLAGEVAALRAQGLRVVPLSLDALPTSRFGALAADAAAAAFALDEAPAVRNPLRLAGASRLAWAQRAMPAGQAFRLGTRVALAARLHGCSGIHAAATDAAAIAALIGGRLAGRRVSIAGHGRDVYAAPGDLALKLRSADLAIAECTEMAEDFRSLAPDAKVRAVPRGIDVARFPPAGLVERNGRLLCMAPLVPCAGIPVLLAALAALPQGQRPVVDLVGSGALLETLRAEALHHGVSDQVRFLGERAAGWLDAEGPRYLGLVAPGIIAPDGDRDPAPIAVLRAMAMGLPVLASCVMGLREMVQPDAGHLVPPGQATPLAHGLRWLASMPEHQRRRLDSAGRDRVLASYTLAGRAAALSRVLSGRLPDRPENGRPMMQGVVSARRSAAAWRAAGPIPDYAPPSTGRSAAR